MRCVRSPYLDEPGGRLLAPWPSLRLTRDLPGQMFRAAADRDRVEAMEPGRLRWKAHEPKTQTFAALSQVVDACFGLVDRGAERRLLCHPIVVVDTPIYAVSYWNDGVEEWTVPGAQRVR